MKRNKLIAYAMAFASYLLQSIRSESGIRNIILFGSVARNDFDKESDVDIFIDTKDKIEKEVHNILDSFYESVVYKRYWKLLDITNEISLKIGDLDKWDLRRSVLSHGLSLYGKYTSELGGKLYSMFILDIRGKRNEKLKTWRKLYGYKQKVNKKEYSKPGLADELGARRLGPAVFILPLEHTNIMKQFLIKRKVKHRIIELQTDALG